MAQPPNTKELKKHLERLGFKFGKSPKVIDSELVRLLGKARGGDYLDAAQSVCAGRSGVSKLYRTVRDAREAHLLFSHQVEVVLATYDWVARAVATGAQPESEVLDLGAGTGALLSWLRILRPDVDLFGAERESQFVDIARELCGDGATIIRWDYCETPCPASRAFQTLVSVLGIDFAPSDHARPGLKVDDACEIRRTAAYCQVHEQVREPLKHWRSAATGDATLLAVLRLPNVHSILAVADAALEVGWSLDLTQSGKLTVGGEPFPALRFISGSANSINDAAVISWWSAADVEARFAAPLGEASAIAIYSALGRNSARILARRYDDGHVMTWEVGVAGGVSYLMRRATTGFAQLQIAPLAARLELEARAEEEKGGEGDSHWDAV